jgi:hypothetical protein
VGGTVQWIKPRRTHDRFYPAGYSLTLTASGSPYVAPTTDVSVLSVISVTDGTPNVTLTYDAGGLYRNAKERGQLLGLPAEGAYGITIPKPSRHIKSQYTINPVNGVITGSIYDFRTKTRRYLFGVVNQGDNTAVGVFRAFHLTGGIVITPDQLTALDNPQ